MSDPLTNWIDGRIRVAVDEALVQLAATIQAEMQAMETNLTAQITSLPGLLASQIQNVALDAGAVAQKVVSAVNGQLAGFPQQIIQGVTGQFTTLPQQIIQGVLAGLPHIPNIFGEK